MMKIAVGFMLLFLSSCMQSNVNDKYAIKKALDQWHQAAANGDIETYFDLLHSEGHFLGTDKTEDWDKQEFYDFCKPYFEDGKAWDFKPVSRKVYFSPDKKTVWFNEVLDTWMGPCRGSGIMIRENNSWKLMQYNLAMLVDNELIKDYLKLLEKPKDE